MVVAPVAMGCEWPPVAMLCACDSGDAVNMHVLRSGVNVHVLLGPRMRVRGLRAGMVVNRHFGNSEHMILLAAL